VITVNLPGPLRPYAGGNAHVTVDKGPCSVGDVLHALEQQHPGVGRRVTDEQGRIRSHVHVYVGDERAKDVTDQVDDGAEVTILAAVSGG
jgi:molybdopterin synthase sulfur carrier subunit